MKSLELFAGIGGIALAAEWAGIETVAFCEKDEFCQKILRKHWPDVPIFDDITTLNKESLEERGVDIGAIELISGGFPCQPYSIAGKRKGKEDDRDLWPEMFRVIQEIKPTWVVGENVANFVNMELERTLSDLEGEGYETQTFVIPALAVGARHRRDRVFIVAYSQGERSREKRGNQSVQSQERITRSGKDLANTYSARLERKNESELESSNITGCSVISNTKNQGDVWGNRELRDYEKIRRTRRDYRKRKKTNDSREWWSTEPNVGRVAHGVPDRVDRLKGLGNAVVPQQIYPIFKAIMDVS